MASLGNRKLPVGTQVAAHSSVLWCARAQGISMMNSLSDLLHAARTLTRARAFTAVCVVSLGLGMGVVIAILLLMRIVIATPPRVDDKGLVELVVRPSGQLLRAGRVTPSSTRGRSPITSMFATPPAASP